MNIYCILITSLNTETSSQNSSHYSPCNIILKSSQTFYSTLRRNIPSSITYHYRFGFGPIFVPFYNVSLTFQISKDASASSFSYHFRYFLELSSPSVLWQNFIYTLRRWHSYLRSSINCELSISKWRWEM